MKLSHWLALALALGSLLVTPLRAVNASSLSSFGGIEEPETIYHPVTDKFTSDSYVNITDQGNGRFRMLLRYHANDWWDGDRTTTSNDRGRAEVKVLGPRQRPGETFEYGSSWRTSPGTKIGSRFYHITQVKGYGGPDTGTPLITTTLRGGNQVNVEYHSASGADGVARSWSWADNQWTRSVVRLKINTVADGLVQVSVNGDSFTGVTGKAIYRVDAPEYQPKWGLYRGTDNGTPYGTDDYMEHENVTAIQGTSDPVAGVITPAFSPTPGAYATAQTVTISSDTVGATIRYTTDGSLPGPTAGTVYTGSVTIGATTTLKAVAYTAAASSPVASGTYTIGGSTVLAWEAEDLAYVATPSSIVVKVDTDSAASAGKRLTFNFDNTNEWLDLTLPNVPAGTYSFTIAYRSNNNRGQYTVAVDGTPLGGTVDMYSSGASVIPITLGNVTFATAGNHTLRLAVVGRNAASSSYTGSVDQFTLTGVASAEPAITNQPAAQTVNLGASASLTVLAGGAPPLTFQWTKDDRALAGATSATLALGSAQVGDAGDYRVTVSNALGTVTSVVATLSVAANGIALNANPVSQSTTIGGSATLAVDAETADGSPVACQWYRDGVAVAGATSDTLELPCVQAFQTGTYTAVLSAPGGTLTSSTAVVAATEPPASNARLLSLSTRGLSLTGDNLLIPGFVIQGSGTKRLLIRGIGPTLALFGIANHLPNPRLVLKRLEAGAWTAVTSNDDWGTNANVQQVIDTSTALQAFALQSGSKDAAFLLDLEAGMYSVVCDDTAGATGVAIVELYDADGGTPTAKLTSISNRGYVGTGGDIMIPGFVVSNEGPKTFLVRVVGPRLSDYGLAPATLLADPQVTIYRRTDGQEKAILSNNDWGTDADAARTAQVATQLQAFPLASGSKDAAFVVTLPPGIYTAAASGVGGTTGIALVEIYQVP